MFYNLNGSGDLSMRENIFRHPYANETSAKKLTFLLLAAISGLIFTSSTFGASIENKEEAVVQCDGFLVESGMSGMLEKQDKTKSQFAESTIKAAFGPDAYGLLALTGFQTYKKVVYLYMSKHTTGQVRRLEQRGSMAFDSFANNHDMDGATKYFENCNADNAAVAKYFDW